LWLNYTATKIISDKNWLNIEILNLTNIKILCESLERDILLSHEPEVLRIKDNNGKRIKVSKIHATNKIFSLIS
jgi:hypothetical protein